GRYTGANVRGRRRPVAGIEMLLFAIEHQLDRRLRLLRELRADQSLGVRTELAAEPAAHVLRDAVHVRLRNLESLRELLRRLNHRLRRDPGRQLVAIPLADTTVCLETDVRNHMGGVRGVDDVRRFRESVLERAGLVLRAVASIS